MSVRIRYSKTNEADVLESTRVFEYNDATYRVRLNTKELSFVIFDAKWDSTIATGSGASLQILKKRVKESLESLGISFEKENRKREPKMPLVALP